MSIRTYAAIYWPRHFEALPSTHRANISLAAVDMLFKASEMHGVKWQDDIIDMRHESIMFGSLRRYDHETHETDADYVHDSLMLHNNIEDSGNILIRRLWLVNF